jgi:ElaB/YqjD/DUF883 family membrane-anchored ribosome-binding protein
MCGALHLQENTMTNLANDTVVQMRDFRDADTGTRVPLTDAVADAFGRWSDTAKSAAQTADDFVRENPWRAAGIVAVIGIGAGFLAAWLSRRARTQGDAFENSSGVTLSDI